MSSPLNFPPDSDDVPMQQDDDEQLQTPTRPAAAARKLFHTPSVAAGTPMTGLVARRAVGATPRKSTPAKGVSSPRKADSLPYNLY